MPTFPGYFLRIVLLCSVLAAPSASDAAQGDCGQPVSTGSSPTTADALTILKAAVGLPTPCDDKFCICDVNCDGSITIRDALYWLKVIVGTPGFEPMCCCGPQSLACSSARFETRAGSDLDAGWTGIAHDSGLLPGGSTTVRVLRRCSDDQTPCERDEDCGSSNCVPTCDCVVDTTCEFTGPTQDRHCLTNLDDCEANRCIAGATTQEMICATNADCSGGATCSGSTQCPNGIPCVAMAGPPLPLSSGGTPVCIVSLFNGPLTGTANSATGEGSASMRLRSRVSLGLTLDRPCPRCGSPAQAPKIGDSFVCEGGLSNNQACTVDGVSDVFGGVSFDCPPDYPSGVSGVGLDIVFRNVTTGTATKTAQLPCANVQFRSNPMFPVDQCRGGTNDGSTCTSNANCPGGFCNLPKCLDTGESCTSNADCTRCTGDSSVGCISNADCSGKGLCAEAPEQPVTCGFWCHCGFCDGDASSPCFDDSDCAAGQHCEAGPGVGSVQNAPQQKPNDCSGDAFLCGGLNDEECATTDQGECADQPYRSCTEGSTTCLSGEECVISPRRCFEPRITRIGTPSPHGVYCAFEAKACTTNADCTGDGDFCVPDSLRPETVALFCAPATSSSSINSVNGITGPAALRLNGFVEVCRCGDSRIGCDEECDDGNLARFDGCDDHCQDE